MSSLDAVLAATAAAAILARGSDTAEPPSSGGGGATAQTQFVRQDGDVREFLLSSNGLRILLHHRQQAVGAVDAAAGGAAATTEGGSGDDGEESGVRRASATIAQAPVVTHNITYRVGSRDECYGTTGYTHALEHALFKGSPLFNKQRGTSIWSVLQSTGASMNATTSKTRTHFYATLPAEHLELAMRIEADRMRGATFTEADLRSEMTTIRNEFERGESSVDNVLYKALWAVAYEAHPVRIPTIGYRSDLEAMTAAKLRRFYDSFYWPNNAALIVTGDIVAAATVVAAGALELTAGAAAAMDYAQAERVVLQMAARVYGRVPRSPRPPPTVVTVEPRQHGPKVLTVRRAVGTQPIVGVAFKSPAVPLGDAVAAADSELYALLVLDAILSDGVNSRLYRRFVQSGVASSVATSTSQLRDPGLSATYVHLNVEPVVAPAAPPPSVQERLDAVLAGVLAEYALVSQAANVSAAEVQTAVRKLRTAALFGRESSASVMFEINEAVAAGDWAYYTTFVERIERVTPERVAAAARRYAVDDNRTTIFFVPLTADAAADAEQANPLPAAAAPPVAYTGGDGATGGGGGGGGGPAGADSVSSSQRGGGAAAGEGVVPLPAIVAMASSVRVFRSMLAVVPEVYTAQMAVRDLVSVRGSMWGAGAIPADGGGASSARGQMLATATAMMLSEGTQTRSKEEVAAALEALGASVEFSSDAYRLTVSARMLRDSGGAPSQPASGAAAARTSTDREVAAAADVGTVMQLVAEQIRFAKFDAAAFERVRSELRTALAAARRNTRALASIALARTIYTPRDPNYEPTVDELAAALDALSVEQVRRFHNSAYRNQGDFFFVFTGDVGGLKPERLTTQLFGRMGSIAINERPPSRVADAPGAAASASAAPRPLAAEPVSAGVLERMRATAGATSATRIVVTAAAAAAAAAPRSFTLLRINVPDQSSVTLTVGATVGIDAKHPDYVALHMGVFVLGGNFSARLMQEVRDRRGLTYGIGARLRGTLDDTAGHLEITGTFAPALLDKGTRVALDELVRWARGDVTEAEMAAKKRTLLGGYVLGAETTGDFAGRIADAVEQRRGVEWIDEWPERVAALDVDAVNAAIRKHVQLDAAVVVQAGAVF